MTQSLAAVPTRAIVADVVIRFVVVTLSLNCRPGDFTIAEDRSFPFAAGGVLA